ncbi:hypothetical protein LIPSTDRAFT_322061 [Lipomyces starkeyi NRRL Y-11557]|uniref:Uncharacterized protein n=1 Tax=Lipomyces starkeyi NRRL Y-11557 TaxID=675824 RepID=A0A1E3Q3V4_LIPST|nr:hypothetical protein LIPSTDRAFT_322061 [Lipomyces starkeyi NRRL Y-11557]
MRSMTFISANALAIIESTKSKPDLVLHTDRLKWICSSQSYAMNSGYICRHHVAYFAHEKVHLLFNALLAFSGNCSSRCRQSFASMTVLCPKVSD